MQASEGPARAGGPARAEARRFFEAAGPRYDRVAPWATLGQDARWRAAALRCLPRGPCDVLDYACGTGLLSVAAARRAAPGRVVGLDLSPGMLARARERAAREGAGNVRFVLGDAEAWEPPERAFDAATAGYLPKYVAPGRWLPRAARGLRPGGVLATYDFTYPEGRIARRAWEAWWRVLGPRLARQPGWQGVAAELPGLVRRTRWLPALCEALPAAGFGPPRVRRFAGGAAALVVARRLPEGRTGPDAKP